MNPPYSAIIIADSIAPCGRRLITAVMTYPRMVHADFMTHRMLSRNASSSRAMPVERTVRQIISNPAEVTWWGANQRGMQATSELRGWRRAVAERIFYAARWPALGAAWSLMKLGLHKQLANRLLEPWAYITVIVSATDLHNLFALRCHPAAQPEIKRAVEALRAAVIASVPKRLAAGEWHLPFVTDEERTALPTETLVKLSVARCARVSYLTHDGKRDLQRDVELYEQLSRDRHLSPTEHAAIALAEPERHGNFTGFKQLRKAIPNEDGEGAR